VTSPGTARPRVLLVSATAFFGGGEVHYVKLARLLMERYEVAAIVCDNRLGDELEAGGVRVWRLNVQPEASRPRKFWALLWLSIRAVWGYKPRVVHLNGGLELYLAPVIKSLRTPLIVTYHTVESSRQAGIKRRLLTLSLRCAETVICISRAVQLQLQQVFGIRRTIVLSNWLDPMPQPSPRRAPVKDRPLRILYVGRVEPAKGIFDVLAAMKQLSNVRLDVVGGGQFQERAMAEGADLPVTFHGFQADVSPYYRQADLLVLPSWSEGQSLVLMEAMAAGLPCVVSDLAVLMETAGDGSFATAFRVADPDDMARTIRELQQDFTSAIARAEDARKFAERTYSKARIGPVILGVFDRAMGASPEMASNARG
jgi:glycosyltransferase involved in cell wall biosynthesis